MSVSLVPVVPVLTKLPANVAGNATKDDSSVWYLPLMQDTQMKLSLPAFTLD